MRHFSIGVVEPARKGDASRAAEMHKLRREGIGSAVEGNRIARLRGEENVLIGINCPALGGTVLPEGGIAADGGVLCEGVRTATGSGEIAMSEHGPTAAGVGDVVSEIHEPCAGNLHAPALGFHSPAVIVRAA